MVRVAQSLRRGAELEEWKGLEEFRRDLRAFLARRCVDENELEDIIHETYVRAVRYRKGSRPVRLRSWLLSIARNVLFDRRRERERYGPLEVEPEPGEGGELSPAEGGEELFHIGRWALDRESAVLHLRHALAQLREGDRRLLRTFYEGGEDARATACECSIPPHLVKTRLFRARRRLLKALRRHIALRLEVPPSHESRGAVS